MDISIHRSPLAMPSLALRRRKAKHQQDPACELCPGSCPPCPPVPSQMAPGGEGRAVTDGGGCRCSPRCLPVLPGAPRLLQKLHSSAFNRCLEVWWQRKKPTVITDSVTEANIKISFEPACPCNPPSSVPCSVFWRRSAYFPPAEALLSSPRTAARLHRRRACVPSCVRLPQGSERGQGSTSCQAEGRNTTSRSQSSFPSNKADRGRGKAPLMGTHISHHFSRR